MLTAAVFERLAYLGDPSFWSVLQRAFRLPEHADAQHAELVGLDFWPMLTAAADQLGQSVEPDLIVRFAFPEGRSIALVIECKLDAQQTPSQWAQEWIAYLAEERPEPEQETYLLALGGLPFRPAETVERFCAEILRTLGVQVRAAAAEWLDLLRAVEAVEPATSSDGRVLADVREALRFFGVRHFRDLEGLVGLVPSSSLNAHAVATLGRLP